MKIALIVVTILLGGLLLAGGVMYFVGANLPERHTQIASLTVRANRVTVWKVITDYEKMPEWWPDIKAVRFETRPNGEIWTWNRDSHGEEIAFRTLGQREPEQLIREIVGENLPFGGTWTFDLSDVSDGHTRIMITEEGFVKPPVFRVIAKYFIGYDKTMNSFFTNLEKRLAATK
jgi:uncharacterized protein YndB with AHSA1/START domain